MNYSFSTFLGFFLLAFCMTLTRSQSQDDDRKDFETKVIRGRTVKYLVGDRVIDPIGVEVSNITGRIRAGIDPEKTSELFHMLDQVGVVDELGMSDGQIQAWEAYKVIDKAMRIAPNLDYDAFRMARAVGVSEVLDRRQLDRLRQIAYRYEVSMVGLAASLCEGKLGEVAGVSEKQADFIWQRGLGFDRQRNERIRQIMIRSEAEVRSLLDREQVARLVASIGDYFRLPVFAIRTLNLPLATSSPFTHKPESPQFFLALMDRDKDIQDELSLTVKQRNAIIARAQKYRTLGPWHASPPEPENSPILNAQEEFLLEQLSSVQNKRIPQLSYRMEVEAMGLSHALAKGKLKEKVGIREEQIETLMRLGKTLRASEREKVMNILAEYEDKLLESLDPLQRAICHEALGPFFAVQTSKYLYSRWLRHSKYAISTLDPSE